MQAQAVPPVSAHIPVLIAPILQAVAPVSGRWLDGTFGAGGYARALLEAGAEHVTAVDRDPMAFEMARGWAATYGDRLTLQPGNFRDLDTYASDLDGIVLDLGVSSMQLDQAERGFSFQKDGPLDMRMSQDGPSAADLVNGAAQGTLADILYHYGEERAARRIARAIVAARAEHPITTTLQLARLVEGCLPRPKPGQAHPATRSFQALRIAVNDEYAALWHGLMASERALAVNGVLAVVTFHSSEDRMVKRFLSARSGSGGRANRYVPQAQDTRPRFRLTPRKAIAPSAEEVARNPRARSAKLRLARRTDAPAGTIDAHSLAMPSLPNPLRRPS